MKEKKQKQLFYTTAKLEKKYEIFHYLDDDYAHAPLHSHDFYELYFLIAGNLSYQIKDTFYSLKTGDILLFNQQRIHGPLFENLSSNYERIVLRIREDTLAEIS